MSYTFQAQDEQYAYLLKYAEGLGETPEALFQYWVQGISDWMSVQRISRSRKTQQAQQKESTPNAGIPNQTKKEDNLCLIPSPCQMNNILIS